MSQKSLKKFSRQPPTAEEIKKLDRQVRSLDARASAIILASQVEKALEDYLASKMHLPRKIDYSNMFYEMGTLGPFSAKIRIAAAFDLIPPLWQRDLERIKDIRNAFAHTPRPMSFQTPQIKKMCKGFGILSYESQWIRAPIGKSWPPRTPREQFIAVAGLLISFLDFCEVYDYRQFFED